MTSSPPASPPSRQRTSTTASRNGSDWLTGMFHEHGRALLRFVRVRLQDGNDAEDIAQETWLRLQRMDQPGRLDNARAFLFQTAANLVIDRQRRQILERRHLQQEAQAALVSMKTTVSTEQQASAESELALVLRAIDELPMNCRQAFLMHRGRGMSYPEIAKALGVSTSMVEKHVIHALKHCRTRLPGPP